MAIDPVTGLAFGGIMGYGGLLWSKYGPSQKNPTAIIGMRSVGKSTMHISMERNNHPVLAARIPTTERGVRYSTRIPLGNAYYRDPKWVLRDYPHNAEMVPEQVKELKSSWVIWMLATETWQDPYNWRIISELSKCLSDPRHRHKVRDKWRIMYWTPWDGWKIKALRIGKDVKLITMFLNKVDKWDEKGTDGRAQLCHKVIDHFTQEDDDSPMNLIKNEYNFHFIAGSVERGYYYPMNELHQDHKPLRQYVNEVAEHLR